MVLLVKENILFIYRAVFLTVSNSLGPEILRSQPFVVEALFQHVLDVVVVSHEWSSRYIGIISVLVIWSRSGF